MIRPSLLALLIAAPGFATAQPLPPLTTTPLLAPTTQSPAFQPPAPPRAVVPPAAPQPVQPAWMPQGSADLQVLDKVNAQNTVLSVKVGQEAHFGSLNIQVRACDNRPPDQPQDSAAYLTITDSHSDAPGFSGWMLAKNPSVSMLQHPIYDVRVVACKA
jgi:hypothetical protein